jgi:hypothetical protein
VINSTVRYGNSRPFAVAERILTNGTSIDSIAEDERRTMNVFNIQTFNNKIPYDASRICPKSGTLTRRAEMDTIQGQITKSYVGTIVAEQNYITVSPGSKDGGIAGFTS